MLDLLKTTRGRVGLAIITSIVVTVIWFSFELSIAILPAVLVPLWIPIFALGQGEPISFHRRTRMYLALAIGVLTLLIGIRVFVIRS